MTTVTTTLTAVCSGGNHLTFTITGDINYSQVVDISLLTAPLDEEDAKALIRIKAKMAKNGRTLNQAKQLLQNSVTDTL